MSSKQYSCNDGDRIDLIVFKHYGSLERLNDVISFNQNLIKKSMILESGTKIKLPIFTDKKERTVPGKINKKRVPLW